MSMSTVVPVGERKMSLACLWQHLREGREHLPAIHLDLPQIILGSDGALFVTCVPQ